MSVYFYRGHVERQGGTASVGSFCGLSVSHDAVSAFEDAKRTQLKEIQSIAGSGAFNYYVVFDKFEKVE